MLSTSVNSPQSLLLHLNPTKPSYSLHHRLNHRHLLPTQTLTFPQPISKPTNLSLRYTVKPRAAIIPLQPLTIILPSSPKQAISTILSIAFACAKAVSSRVNILASFNDFKEPLIAVIKQMGKWVDLFHSVLMVRILLSWFPNLPWEKQPFSALRDLCDPFLSFCRMMLPPIGTPGIGDMDYSPLFGFALLGVLGNLLKGPVQTPPPMSSN